MAGGSSAPTWEVTGQREDIQAGSTGALVQGVLVTFRTMSGAIGSVFVPHTEYSIERVRQLVGDRAGTVEAVQNLKG